MPFNAAGRWVTVEQAERDLEEPVPDYEASGREEVLGWYQGLRTRLDDRHAFEQCAEQFGFRSAVNVLAAVSAAAKRHHHP